MALECKRQFEAVSPQMLEVGEVLRAPALEDLVPASPRTPRSWEHSLTHGLWLKGAESSCGRFRSAIIWVPHDFPLAGVGDDYTVSGAEVKSRLVVTEVAYGNRNECFAVALPLKALRMVVSVVASRGRRLAFFDVVAAFVHALIDELVILLLPGGLGHQSATA